MKSQFCLMSVATAVILVGCDRNPPTPNDQPVSGQDVRDKYADAASATKQYAVQSKDEFVASMNARLKDMDSKIDQFSAKAADYKDDAKVQADKALDQLRADRAALAKKLDDAKASSQAGWEKTKAACSSAWDDMQKAYYDAKAKFQ